MAGQPLSRLKATEVASPAVRHEARLGILVITILVFAFGFLVYHKMDMHQRSLTQASIPSTAEAQQSAQSRNAASQAGLQSPPSVANDPLLNLADLSDESPFSALELTAATESRANEFSFDEPSAASDSTVIVENTAQATQGPGETEFPSFFDAASNRSNDKEATLVDASQPDFGKTSIADAESMDFSSLSDPPVSEPVLPSSSLDATAARDESSGSLTETATIPFPEPQTDAFATSNGLESPAGEAADDDRVEEPMLLAMLEPQQDKGFSSGFAVDERSVSIKPAPVAEPTDTFPAFDGAETAAPQSQKPKHSVKEKHTAFGFQGYDAVTQPGSRSGKSSIRTAAGSGSDGKFSLAAFNYQNSTAEPAPDDGSTFDSVVVQDGDNYTTISKRVYGTVRYFSALAVFNQHRIREPKSMRPGMVVLTPPKEVLEQRYPQLFVDSQPKIVESAEFLILSDGSPAYRVGERETLSEISARFLGRSSRWIEIYRLNQTIVKDPNKLKAGLILALPSDAAEVSVVP